MTLRLAAALAAFPLLAQDPAAAVQILTSQCAPCHNGTAKMSGLDVTTRDGLAKGGTRGPAVEANASRSLLLKAIRRKAPLAMPPTQALDANQVAVLTRWVEAGAPWPRSPVAAPASKWWAFQKVARPDVPPGEGSPVDRFVNAKLREQNLTPASLASVAALTRRLYFDLTGLAPGAGEAEAARDYGKLVETLLASPRYGEKWGRHWLDLVRYSDTAGFELDSYIPDAWRYRDWVIDAFNHDKPYDRFIREQLAGDEFYPEEPEAVTGTGYFCVGPNRDLYPDQSDINRVETLTDWVDTTGSVFLGLTVGCARCHDHKFDPIPQRDYYRLQAVFAPAVKTKVALSRLASLGFDVAENIREMKLRDIGEEIGAVEQRCREVEKRKTDGDVRACLNAGERDKMAEIERRLVNLYRAYRAKPFACGVNDVGDHSPRTLMPVRGTTEGIPVTAGLLSALGGGDITDRVGRREWTGPIPLNPTTGRRRALADWIATPENPLTARVMVNRIWQYHFGRGLVANPSDFGTRARTPSHPELLDWLAAEFMANNWSVKHVHRLIVNSEAYRRSSVAAAEVATRDPENVYLARFARRRLTPEEIRDATLQASGALNLKAGGRPVVVPLTREEAFNMIGRTADMWLVTADTSEHTRRSVYLFQKRTFRLPVMEVFDSPESMLTCSRRDASTTAPQSLTLLNSAFTVSQARLLGSRLAAGHADDGALTVAAWRAVLGRSPEPREAEAARLLLAAGQRQGGNRQAAAAELVRGLLNLNEFLHVD